MNRIELAQGSDQLAGSYKSDNEFDVSIKYS